MSKDTFYFSHDYNARNDRKLIKLASVHGMQGIGIYWCIVEMLYEESGLIPLEYDRIAFELRTDKSVVQSVIHDFDLFQIDNDSFWSDAVNDRLQERINKSEKARNNVLKRWNKHKKNTAVLPPYESSNTIKERKGKERKGKDNNMPQEKENLTDRKKRLLIARREVFKQRVNENKDYPQKMLDAFFNYWSEANKTGTQMRYEMQKTFEIERRLITWQNNEKNYGTNKPNYQGNPKDVNSQWQ